MPCNSDHLAPTRDEREEADQWMTSARALLDEVVSFDDRLRELILSGDKLGAARAVAGAPPGRFLRESGILAGSLNEVYGPAVTEGHRQMLLALRQQVGEHLKLVDDASSDSICPERLAQIEADQVEHRKADLDRLMKTLGAAGDRERLAKVVAADPAQPLEPQLGFDPDQF